MIGLAENMIALVILGALFQLVGLIGCVLPWLAGPPFNFVGLILLSIAKGWKPFSPTFLVIMGGLTALTLVLDYAMPLAGARRFGASKRGFWGAFIGMLAGAFAFPPFGLILGAFAGAVVGELSAGKEQSKALRAGWGVFVGMMAAMAVKLIVSGIMTFYFIRARL
jgi:uncharacterized protein YqgC (DUF456 family)